MNQWLRCMAGALLCMLLGFAADGHASLAKERTEAFEKRYVSSWLGVVDGEVTTRTIAIKELHPGTDNTLEADARYGTTGSGLFPVRCSITVGEGGTKLMLSSFFGERIEAEEVHDGWFIGTYTYKDGTTTSITIARIWEEALRKNKYSLKGDEQITLLYFGAEDCEESSLWEKIDKPIFLRSKESGQINFRAIKRKVHNVSPEIEDFPDDLKWIFEQAEAGGVSPYFVVAVDKTVILKIYGVHNWDSAVMPLLKDLYARKILASAPHLVE